MNEDDFKDEDGTYEIVADDEPSMEEYQGIGPGPTANDQKVDEFGAPIRPPVKVRDGVRDTRAR